MCRPRMFRAVIPCLVLIATCFASCARNDQTTQANGVAPANSSSPSAAQPNAGAPTNSSSPQAKLNINTATESQLLAGVPGLGNKMVHEFMEYRPYTSIQQFRREIGKYVDANKVAEYERYIFVPINVNDADAPTLMQIPGLSASAAQTLIAGRPYASPDAFMAKLNDKISTDDLDTARSYLATQ